MKNTFLAALLLLLLGAVNAGAQQKAKQKLTINGEVVGKAVKHIAFQGSDIVLTFDDDTSRKTDMGTVSIVLNGATAINQVEAYTLKKPVGDRLELGDVPQGTVVTLYDAKGREVLSTGGNVVDLSGLSSGVYLLKVGRSVVKFVRKQK